MVEKKEDKQQSDEIWQYGEVATQTQPIAVNKKTGEQFDIMQTQVKILNLLERIASTIE
jgi:hypothetical protein